MGGRAALWSCNQKACRFSMHISKGISAVALERPQT